MAKGLETINLNNIRITDSLFGSYSKLVVEKIIPYQWEILNDRIKDAEPSYCIDNFRIAAGEMNGIRKGAVFQDTDLYKWIEAVAFCIQNGSGAEFETITDEAIELIGRAQQEDGYINTYYTVIAPEKRWSNLVEGHELYSAGHLIEASVAYYKATGKKRILEIAQKFADLICKVFGREKDQLRGYPGHQEIELALVKLYRVTNENRYLECARYFIEERGKNPNYFIEEINKRGGYEHFPEFDNYDLKYSQAHMPPVEQHTAEGHAVRAMYMYSAMADLALEYNDEKMIEACQTLWNSVTKKRMYLTGSVGSSGMLERFTTDYDLPNNTNYSETCASIGLMMFGHRMNALTKNAKYYDIVERALYNTVLAGIGVTGDRYFYVNPLEVVPEHCIGNSYMMHIKPVRQRWFSVACCPPNIARTLASLGQYIYAIDSKAIYINQFISSTAEVMIGDAKVTLELESSMLQDGKVKLVLKSEIPANLTVKVRIPEYAGNMKATQNGQAYSLENEDGYACFAGVDLKENRIEIDFDVKPKWISANTNVRADEGKVALMKGPCVYCMEEEDNGKNLASIYVSVNAETKEEKPLELFGALPTIKYNGIRLTNNGVKEDELYGSPLFNEMPTELKAIPYCLWNNRGEGEMLIWHKVRF